MRNPFNFEAEPFEFDSEFDEFEEVQSAKPCQCHKRSRNSAEFSEEYEEEQSDIYSEFNEEFESDFEEKKGVFKPRPTPICKAGFDDLAELKNRIDSLNYMWENGRLDNIEDSSKGVIQQGNLIRTRLKNGWYKRKGCKADELKSIEKLKTTK